MSYPMLPKEHDSIDRRTANAMILGTGLFAVTVSLRALLKRAVEAPEDVKEPDAPPPPVREPEAVHRTNTKEPEKTVPTLQDLESQFEILEAKVVKITRNEFEKLHLNELGMKMGLEKIFRQLEQLRDRNNDLPEPSAPLNERIEILLKEMAQNIRFLQGELDRLQQEPPERPREIL